MAERKTRPTGASVSAFLDTVENPQRRADTLAVLALMRELSGFEPEMWGPAIVGFGRQDLAYADGSKLEWPVVGFSPRKSAMVLYLMDGYEGHADLLAALGPHSTGRSCLYIKKLADVDQAVLARLVQAGLQ
jgi:hypothetical protein